MIEIQELNKENMDSVKELAATSLKISEAKNIIFKLQEDETVYLEEREKKALAKIDKVIDDSRELLALTKGNYNEVHEFCRNINEFASFLLETNDKFQNLITDFKDKNDIWDKEVEIREKEFAEIRKEIIINQVKNDNDMKNILREKSRLKDGIKKLESDRGLLERNIIRFNNKKNG